MYQSRQAIGKQDECLLVEGYTDVISLHQGGVENVVSSSGTSLTEDQLRLIGQLTKNLTILYDGDPAGIKAALRGLDMALSQSFNVQLVLLPEGEDPDSYVQKSGSAKFHEYIKGHKQDVISFRLQVGLNEAGTDPVKRSKLVNEIAESISRINKAEDFSLQAHYSREAARKLNVDEAGLINLINKHIRERIENEQKHTRKEEALPKPDLLSLPQEEDLAPDKAVNPDELQEWQLLRALIENGHQPYEGYDSVAKMIEEQVEPELLEDPLVRRLFEEYMDHYNRFGATPELHYFINHPDQFIRDKMASLLHPRQDISQKWKEKYGIESLTGNLVYMNEVDSTLSYFKLKKILIIQNQLTTKLSSENDPIAQQVMQKKFIELRQMEREILKRHGTVVFKSYRHK
jgi:DNA primase